LKLTRNPFFFFLHLPKVSPAFLYFTAMSSIKALFVVVLAAACSQVRMGEKGNARGARPLRGGRERGDVFDFFFF